MRRLLTVLSVLLVVQVGLAAAMAFSGRSIGTLRQGQRLLRFDPVKVDRIVIRGHGQGRSLILTKGGKVWRLPGLFGFPASPTKVEAFETTLAGLKPRLPVATTEDAATRFKVSASAFERKITLQSGDRALATLFLGDADGARRSYARTKGSDAIYEVDLGAYQASTKPGDWSDPDFLHVNTAGVSSVQLPGVVLLHKGGRWEAEDLAANQVTDQAQAVTLVDQLTNLSYLTVLGTKDQPAYRQEKPVLQCTLNLKSGNKLTYVFSKPDKGGDYVLKTSGHEYYFKVPQYAVKELLEVDRKKLVHTTKTAGLKLPHTTSKPD